MLSPTSSCFSGMVWAHQSDGRRPTQNLPSMREGDGPGLDTHCLGHLSLLSPAIKLISNKDSNSPAACRNNSIQRPNFSSPTVQEQPRTGWRSGRCQNEESDPQPLLKGQRESCCWLHFGHNQLPLQLGRSCRTAAEPRVLPCTRPESQPRRTRTP